MEKRERKGLLKSKIRKELSAIMELPNHRDVLTRIHCLMEQNPESNKDTEVFYKLAETKLIEKKGKNKTRNEREFSVILMAGFLWKYEGTYMLCADVFCYILVVNGHDLFNPITRQYVDTLEEIGEVDMSTKLKFLERHDFDMFIQKQDQILRNKIAHHDYTFSEAGNVRLGKENLDIFSRVKDFVMFTSDAFITLCDCLEEFLDN
jgi:hypothetical protein